MRKMKGYIQLLATGLSMQGWWFEVHFAKSVINGNTEYTKQASALRAARNLADKLGIEIMSVGVYGENGEDDDD